MIYGPSSIHDVSVVGKNSQARVGEIAPHTKHRFRTPGAYVGEIGVAGQRPLIPVASFRQPPLAHIPWCG